MISIIVPTYNEGKYLPRLLESIKNQTNKDYEVIISDGHSKDNTLKIAKKFGCKIAAPSSHPGIGRNKGAKIAKGEYLLFLDADVVLPPDFLESVLEQAKAKFLDMAAFYSTPVERRISYKVIWELSNVLVAIFQHLYPLAGGWGILVKKKLHKDINGFDETIIHFEDTEYARRASKRGKFGVIWKPKIYLSMRRLANEGILGLIKKYMETSFYRLYGKEFRQGQTELKKFYYDLHEAKD